MAGRVDFDCGGCWGFQAAGLAGAKRLGAPELASHSEEREVGKGGHSLWIYVKTGAIIACGNSSDDLHQMGSFSPSIQSESE